MSSRKNERNGATSRPTTTTTTYEYQFPQPKEKISFSQFVYNSKDGTFFGRDGSSWYYEPANCTRNSAKTYGTFNTKQTDDKFKYERLPPQGSIDSTNPCAKLLLFYVVFYAVLAGLFAICMQGLFATLDDNEPKWKLDSSIIGTNPGLGFRPLTKQTERGSILDFNVSKNETQDYWINLIDEFLAPYANRSYLKNQGQNQKPCDFTTKLTNSNNVCEVDLSHMDNCSRKNNYGYKNQRPCIFLKLNKIFDWIPDYYDNPADFPSDMPAELKTHISSIPSAERKQVWVSCKGLHGHDDDLIQNITYFPSNRGFPSYYYPYKNKDNYLSPLVAVQIQVGKLGQIVNIECRAWAKNIIYSGSLRDRQGSVTFQLLIDDEDKKI